MAPVSETRVNNLFVWSRELVALYTSTVQNDREVVSFLSLCGLCVYCLFVCVCVCFLRAQRFTRLNDFQARLSHGHLYSNSCSRQASARCRI